MIRVVLIRGNVTASYIFHSNFKGSPSEAIRHFDFDKPVLNPIPYCFKEIDEREAVERTTKVSSKGRANQQRIW